MYPIDEKQSSTFRSDDDLSKIEYIRGELYRLKQLALDYHRASELWTPRVIQEKDPKDLECQALYYLNKNSDCLNTIWYETEKIMNRFDALFKKDPQPMTDQFAAKLSKLSRLLADFLLTIYSDTHSDFSDEYNAIIYPKHHYFLPRIAKRAQDLIAEAETEEVKTALIKIHKTFQDAYQQYEALDLSDDCPNAKKGMKVCTIFLDLEDAAKRSLDTIDGLLGLPACSDCLEPLSYPLAERSLLNSEKKID